MGQHNWVADPGELSSWECTRCDTILVQDQKPTPDVRIGYRANEVQASGFPLDEVELPYGFTCDEMVAKRIHEA